jgi:membrane-bound serine protease (ClpP class)
VRRSEAKPRRAAVEALSLTRFWPALIALAVGLLAAGAALGQTEPNTTVPSIELTGSIDPAAEKWINSALDDAASDHAPLAIIRIDTPGGLESSMRDIVKDIIAAPMPVVVYVSPDGARAASAGAFIAESADVVAMAPQTNIGSASAIQANGQDIGGTLGVKIENDAAAFMRALATSHGRDGDVPSQMVTDASNFTAQEALDANAIDIVASSQDDLLTQLDGFQVKGPKATTLHTAGLQIDERDTPLQYDLLKILVDPTVAYLLLLVGIIGIAVELFSPGLIVPGAVGVVALLLGAFGSAQLPVTPAGIALLILGVVLIIAEVHLPTHGLLGVAGVVALVAAGLLLFNTNSTSFEVSVPVVIVVGVLLGGGLLLAVTKAVEARGEPVRAGPEELVGAVGEIRVPLDPVGQIYVSGALWRARLADDASPEDVDRARERGGRVRIEAVEGLTLRVRPASSHQAVVGTTATGQGERT